MTELSKKEHKNWVMVGCALNITKNGITPKIQREMETWYQSLISSPPLQSLAPCTCAPRAIKCVSCVTWETELKRHHKSTRPKICWDNSDKKQWGSPTGAWEVAKVFMPTLGSRKTHIVNAENTDIGGLLNLLEWCPFITPPVSRKVLGSARDECRNHWAHAPKQELQDADVPTIFGHLNSLLSDPVFNADKAAHVACKDLQDLFYHGLVNVRDSEVEALQLLRQSLVADLSKCKDDLADAQEKVVQVDEETKKINKIVQKDLPEVKERGELNREEIDKLTTEMGEVEKATQRDLTEVKEQSNVNREEIDNLRQQLETKLREVEENLYIDMPTILHAVDDFNRQLKERDDLREAFEVICHDVEDMRNCMRNVAKQLNAIKLEVPNLETNLASMKCEAKEMANKVATNENTISSLQKDVTEVKEEMETLKGNALQGGDNGNGDILCTAPSRLSAFTGRESALEWLERRLVLESPEKRPGMSCCTRTICGLGGCGKTSLAVEFAWRRKNRFPGGVFWINGESDENIRKSVAEILALVSIPTSTSENIDDALNKFLAWLSKKKFPWLLVVDNADELQSLTCPTGVTKICKGPWQRNGNTFKHGHILLTTRQNEKDTRTFLKVSSDDCLELQCFSEEEGARFLMQRIGLKGEPLDPDAILLAKELGALPLALEQAAAYMSASPIPLSFQVYLNKYRAVKLRLLQQQPAAAHSLEAHHRLSVHTTWEMNFEFVKEKSPAAALMMCTAAFLESENIPIVVINPGFPELDQEELRGNSFSEVDVSNILKVLSSYSLFSVDHQTRVFGVHKLVQEVVRGRLMISERIEALVAGIRVLHFAFRECPRSEMKEEDANIVLALLLNFRKLKNHIEEQMQLPIEKYHIRALVNDNTLKLSELAFDITRNNISHYRLSAELSDFKLKVFMVCGDTDPNALLLEMVNTSISKRNCSTPENRKEAKKLSENTVQNLIELERSGAIIEADVRYAVLAHRASYYALEGQWEENYNALLKLEVLPLSDANIVDLQMCIGNAENYISACNFQSSLKRYENALKLARKIYPCNHPELLRLLQYITMLFYNEGKFIEAKKYAEEMREICKDLPSSSDCYIMGMTSALTVISEFDPKGSENILLDVLKDRWPHVYNSAKDIYSDNCEPIVDDGSDKHAAIVLQGVMECFIVVSRAATKHKISTKKLNFYRRIGEILVSIRKKFHGDIHPGMEAAYTYLRNVHKLLGTDIKEVFRLQELVVKCQQGEFKQMHQSAPCDSSMYDARRYKNFGNALYKSGDYLKALEFYNKALNLSPNDAKLLTNRAAAFVKCSEQQEQSQTEEQRNVLEYAFQDSVKSITEDPSWVKGYYWRAVCLAKLGQRGPSIAAAAVAEHLFPSQCTQIPEIVERFGRYNANVVNTVEDLLRATERTDNNLVILVNEGRYALPKPLKPPTNAVIVGHGDVQITCTKGVPVQLDETVYVENISFSPTMESINKLKAQAKQCLHRGQLDMALSLYSKALTTCPNDAQLLTSRASTYLKTAEQNKDNPSDRQLSLVLALQDSEAAITADPTWLLGYYSKAVSLAELDKKTQALAAAAMFKHLSSSRDIASVTQRYGGVRVHVVENSDELHCVLQGIEELEGVNQVVLIKEGMYLLEKNVEITKPIVIAGQGKVILSCKSGTPFQFTQKCHFENIELCGDRDVEPESQSECMSSSDTESEVISLPAPSGYEHTNTSECKVN